jgi:hypothetical protein
VVSFTLQAANTFFRIQVQRGRLRGEKLAKERGVKMGQLRGKGLRGRGDKKGGRG